MIAIPFFESKDRELYTNCASTTPINIDSKDARIPSITEYSFTVSLIPSSGYIAKRSTNVIPPPKPLKYFLFIPLCI